MACGCSTWGQRPCGRPGARLAPPWTLQGHTFATLSFLFCVCCKTALDRDTASGETECGAASSWAEAPGGSGLEQRLLPAGLGLGPVQESPELPCRWDSLLPVSQQTR